MRPCVRAHQALVHSSCFCHALHICPPCVSRVFGSSHSWPSRVSIFFRCSHVWFARASRVLVALCIPTVSLAPRRPHVRPRPQGADPGFGPRCAPRLTGADSMVLSPHRRCVSAASTKPTCPESCCAGRSLCFFPNAYPFSYISYEKGTTHPFRHRVCPE